MANNVNSIVTSMINVDYDKWKDNRQINFLNFISELL